MRCPQCQTSLVELPTLQIPPIDICPKQDGIWMDAGELGLFVEGDHALTSADDASTQTEHRGAGICPRCSSLLDPRLVSEVSVSACSSCHGWWLPNGSLTKLCDLYTSRRRNMVDEASLYQRAADRIALRRSAGAGVEPIRPSGLIVWFAFAVAGLLTATLLSWETAHKIAAAAQWRHPPDEFFVYLLIGAFGGILLFLYGFRIYGRKRLVEQTPTSPIRALSVGLVEVVGKAEADGPLLVSPFSGTPCVLFSYTVKERRGAGKESRWVTVAKGTSEQPFAVRDESGAVLVVPMDAELLLREEQIYRWEWPLSVSMNGRDATALDAHPDLPLADSRYRCTEALIVQHEQVYVLGTAQINPAASDAAENEGRLYIGSQRGAPFFISDRSERDLLTRMKWQAFGMVYGGPALTLICLILIFHLYVISGR